MNIIFLHQVEYADEIFPKLKPCVDEYLQAFQVLRTKKIFTA